MAYSEALSTQPWLKSTVLRLEQNVAAWAPGSKQSSTGNPFQIAGPELEKALQTASGELEALTELLQIHLGLAHKTAHTKG